MGILGVLIYLILGIVASLGLILHFVGGRKYRCKGCSQKIDSTQIVCKHCGTFLETKMGNGKGFRRMGSLMDGKIQDSLKKRSNNDNKWS